MPSENQSPKSDAIVQYVLLSIFAAVFIATIIRLIIGPVSAGMVTVCVISAGGLVVAGFSPQLQSFKIGKEGFEAQLKNVAQQVQSHEGKLEAQSAKIDEHSSELARQQELINDLVRYSMSASIFRHLCGIALLREYIYHDKPTDERELYFLRDNGFVEPSFLEFNRDLDGQNLAAIAKPTPIGLTCIRLRKSRDTGRVHCR